MVILVMGVTGSGKTTVGKLLSKRLGFNFLDADDFHSSANRDKMRRGIPLSDENRAPWLRSIHDELVRANGAGENIVLACSALKQEYRNTLSADLNVVTVFLRGTVEQLHRNLTLRTGHYAGQSLVPSQLATLEEPSGAIVEDISSTPEEIVDDVCARLRNSGLE